MLALGLSSWIRFILNLSRIRFRRSFFAIQFQGSVFLSLVLSLLFFLPIFPVLLCLPNVSVLRGGELPPWSITRFPISLRQGQCRREIPKQSKFPNSLEYLLATISIRKIFEITQNRRSGGGSVWRGTQTKCTTISITICVTISRITSRITINSRESPTGQLNSQSRLH